MRIPLVPTTGLEDERRDRVRALELHRLFDHGERSLGGLPSALDAVIRIEHAHHARNAGLSGPSARITCQAKCCPQSRRDTNGSAP